VKQRVSGPMVLVVILVVLLAAFVFFSRAEWAPPGVGVHRHGEEEEAVPLPWSPPVDPGEQRTLRKGLLPLGILAVFPPIGEDRGKGVRVAAVRPGSPAAQAGLEPGDLIKAFDAKRLGQPWGLVALLTAAAPDQQYDMAVLRAGKERKLVVTGITPLPPEERVR